MALLVTLISAAHFLPLSRRDVELSRSLNSDYLWQLFIKAGTDKLDASLLATRSSTPQPLLPELGPLRIWKRGYGCEVEQGRLMIQKVDYLQILMMKSLIGAVASLWQRARPGAVSGSEMEEVDEWRDSTEREEVISSTTIDEDGSEVSGRMQAGTAGLPVGPGDAPPTRGPGISDGPWWRRMWISPPGHDETDAFGRPYKVDPAASSSCQCPPNTNHCPPASWEQSQEVPEKVEKGQPAGGQGFSSTPGDDSATCSSNPRFTPRDRKSVV